MNVTFQQGTTKALWRCDIAMARDAPCTLPSPRGQKAGREPQRNGGRLVLAAGVS